MMRKGLQTLSPSLIQFNQRASATRTRALSPVNAIISPLEQLDINDFRQQAFLPQQPLLIANPTVNTAAASSIPATNKWFTVSSGGRQVLEDRYLLNNSYLGQFGHTLLPYELLSCPSDNPTSDGSNADSSTFQRFHAPLDLFLTASKASSPPRLYLAQAQLLDLPQQLQDDLPTPSIVRKAGRGDVYDANIWMGLPPTYTPLHKDPNPNLFVQLVSSKAIRLFKPEVGAAIFRGVQEKIGRHASAALRGDEMMQGPERRELENAVWDCPNGTEGYEVVVRPGDALFIPKGWWHSIKSLGEDITASVNWWFR